MGLESVVYAREPEHQHGQAERTGVLLVNLGTPQAPTASALRRYLRQFLSDLRVVEIPRLLWWPILHGIILNTRPSKSAAKYASVWMAPNPMALTPAQQAGGSPLAVWTRAQAEALQAWLQAAGHTGVLVRYAMRYGQPAVAEQLDALRAQGATRVLVLPLYPQYAAATTGSVADALAAWVVRARRVPDLRLVAQYHDDPGYIRALSTSVRAQQQAQGGPATHLVMSFHGLPERSLHVGDPYHCQCLKTARLLGEALGLARTQYSVTFQSRFGKAKWLEPATEPTLVQLAQQGTTAVDVVCPGFVADCLETLEEIQIEAQAAFKAAGGTSFRYLACLNTDAAWIHALGELALRNLQGWPLGPEGPSGASEWALAESRERALRAGAKA